MKVSAEILAALESSQQEVDVRGAVAKWLATHSFVYYTSGNELERRIVGEMDATLGKIQHGVVPEARLAAMAKRMAAEVGT